MKISNFDDISAVMKTFADEEGVISAELERKQKKHFLRLSSAVTVEVQLEKVETLPPTGQYSIDTASGEMTLISADVQTPVPEKRSSTAQGCSKEDLRRDAALMAMLKS